MVLNVTNFSLFNLELSANSRQEGGTEISTDSKESTNYSLVTPYQLLMSLESAKYQRECDFILMDLRDTFLYQSGHICTAMSANCNTKLMARRTLSKWLNSFPNQPVFMPYEHALFSSQFGFLPLISRCIVLYDQSGRSFQCQTSDSRNTPPSIDFFIERLIEKKNRVVILRGGFEAFRNLPTAGEFIECGIETARPSRASALGGYCHRLTPLLYTDRKNSGAGCDYSDDRSSICHQSEVHHDPEEIIYHAEISQLFPFLYIGNEQDSKDLDLLNRLGITHILNVTAKVPMTFESLNRFQYLRLPACDTTKQDLKPLFDKAVEFIDDARASNGVILVHCMAGVSRSVAVVLAYLLHLSPLLSVLEAFDFIQKRRPIAGPNLHFMGQLEGYRSRCLISCSSKNPARAGQLLG